MFVYRDLTSMVMSRQSLGAFVSSILFIASMESCNRCGKLGSVCFRASSSTLEADSVGPLVPETIGLTDGGFL